MEHKYNKCDRCHLPLTKAAIRNGDLECSTCVRMGEKIGIIRDVFSGYIRKGTCLKLEWEIVKTK